MPTRTNAKRHKPRAIGASEPLEQRVDIVLTSLKKAATKQTLDGMARYAIPSDKAFGVSVANLQKMGKQLGRDHPAQHYGRVC